MTEPNGLSRRAFVRQTAALTGGALVGASLPAGAPPQAAAHAASAGEAAQQAASHLTLWYQRPASQWVEALPIGNGRLGAMVFGGIERERLQLNDDTLWSGGPRDWNNPKAPQVLADVRRLIAEEKYAEADRAARGMQGPYTQSFEPLGNLHLTFEHGDVARGGYRRQLDLQSAIAAVRYRVGATNYLREMFVSHPDRVIVVRLTADRPGMITFTATLDSLLRHRVASEGGVLKLLGKAPANADPNYVDSATPVTYSDDVGMTFEAHLSAAATGGRQWIDDGGLHVRGADEVVLRVSAATSFNGYDKSPVTEGRAPGPIAAEHVRAATSKPYAALREAHVAAHRALFDRVSLTLVPAAPPTKSPQDLPTDERINTLGATDLQLVTLLFQFGRYLLISSSRPGTQPANLQGIWNDQTRPPWSSNYTTNINAQMNYWPAETTNLAELHEPFIDFIERVAVNGHRTAQVNYGARGWVAHHNSDIWAQSAPVGDYGKGDPVWANWHGGSAWLSKHLWEHYAFGGDVKFLRERAYPVMKAACEFYLDFLVSNEQGYLVTSPSASPELRFELPDGGTAALSAGATMDRALVWDLFTNTIEASMVLNSDAAFRERIGRTRAKLIPYQVGKRGQLQEWAKDFEEQDPQHRHFSHLFGVYPGREITRDGTPAIYAAARRAMEIRGDAATGWSMAWKTNFWARMQDGDHAHLILTNLLKPAWSTATNYSQGGGVYPNLFDAHPPFQIDGNFGATAGIAEMLVQSHAGEIHLLPALPSAWPAGQVRGLRARGGVEVDIDWSDRVLRQATLTSDRARTVRVRHGATVTEHRLGARERTVIRV
ncbi:MAG TPA: glycoside hydrolase family 95 protein [Gemmatimonadaceae bacterium]|nr:glycoside hydrolase family 95 protein [Gemmatimonadaceae bacterium]